MRNDHDRSLKPLTSSIAARPRWARPRADVVRMDAEIGSYQEDQDPRREDRGPVPMFSQS